MRRERLAIQPAGNRHDAANCIDGKPSACIVIQ